MSKTNERGQPAAATRGPPLACRLTVLNRYGMYGRCAALFVKTVVTHGPGTEVRVSRADRSVNARSIMGLMTLEATQGTALTVTARGQHARDVLTALAELIDAGFFRDESCIAPPRDQGRVLVDCPAAPSSDDEARDGEA